MLSRFFTAIRALFRLTDLAMVGASASGNGFLMGSIAAVKSWIPSGLGLLRVSDAVLGSLGRFLLPYALVPPPTHTRTSP